MNLKRLQEGFMLNNATSPMKIPLKLPLSSSKPWEVSTFALTTRAFSGEKR